MRLDPVGVYLHGSLAMNCFYRAKSDVDLLVVVPETLSEAERGHAARALAQRSGDRPMLGDLELSVLTVEQAANHQHPRPFEVHYSAAWTAEILADRVDCGTQHSDPDLAAHITVVRQRGAVVSGPSPADLFAEVPHDDYLAAITSDLHEVLSGDSLLSAPYYGVLNACRVLATLKLGPGTVLSKEEGAVWARDSLPTAHLPLVEQALSCYRSARPVAPQDRDTDGHDWDTDALLTFRDAVRAQL
ncbi:aminoglycoside adenylyltransferase domain-containing protein [Kribbella sp. NPDC049174]|uniref:aminoglycoside adenylyltransferase domain-containing protein n=1 Tax=Kribbella sp. NPDC049174 TaxID=3364112 RepID=UPI0037175245